MNRVLLVEDEPSIADALIYALKSEGYAVTHATTLGEARKAVQSGAFAIAVLDVGLPDGSGFDFCKEIYQTTPVLFLTARNSEIDRVVGLEIGADDYVTKPFSPREVTARVKAILRRRGPQAASTPAPVSSKRFVVDDEKKKITYKGKSLELSRYEFGLLRLLALHPGRVYSREQLMESVWADPEMSLDRTVDAHIKMLRQKLRDVDASDDPIVTHRGLGYSVKEDS
ncbi:MAG TPA: two-component system response regulator CreB [Bdellovibrionales bacterium]|nr:two-component system response regulator CreB [Bdellovibrionales bacterium]